MSPEALDGLMEMALIQSTGASNRIENISTSDARLHELLLEDAAPRNRNEQEILAIATFSTLFTTAMTTFR